MINVTSNIEELITQFKNKSQELQRIDVNQALIAGVNAAMGEMKNRIFNQGLATDGITLGQYTGKKKKQTQAEFKKFQAKRKSKFLIGANLEFSEYEIKRVKAGRQVRYKDLEFTGDLRRGIVVVSQTQLRVVCSIPNTQLFLIAQGQTEQISKIRGEALEIFALSESERDTLIRIVTQTLKQLYARIFST